MPRVGRFLTALGRARVTVGEFEAADANLTEAHAVLSESKGATDRDRTDVLDGLVELYDALHAAEPDKDFDAQAAEWRAKLAERRAKPDQVEPSVHQAAPPKSGPGG